MTEEQMDKKEAIRRLARLIESAANVIQELNSDSTRAVMVDAYLDMVIGQTEALKHNIKI